MGGEIVEILLSETPFIAIIPYTTNGKLGKGSESTVAITVAVGRWAHPFIAVLRLAVRSAWHFNKEKRLLLEHTPLPNGLPHCFDKQISFLISLSIYTNLLVGSQIQPF